MAGGSIELELTGAVASPFMLMYAVMYKNNVRKAGMKLMIYERYIDDSNQVAEVPPPGSKYERNSNKVIIDPDLDNIHENDDERTAIILTDIANDVMPGIVMEYDVPTKNTDDKMAILDMKVWLEKEDGNILFQHYEKPTDSI